MIEIEAEIPEAFQGLFDPARHKAYYGGRGSAKSHSFAGALLIQAREEFLRVLCTREVQNSIRDSVKRLLDDKIEQYQMNDFFVSTDREIRGKNGSLFVFSGLRGDSDATRSKEGFNRAWVEEAHSVSQSSLQTLYPTIRGNDKNPSAEIWYAWNPHSPKDPVDNMFRGGIAPPRSIIKEVSWEDNPFFPDVLMEDMAWDRRRDPDKYQHIWLGGYRKHSEATVFRNWKIENFITPEGVRFYFGADWGFSVDPTVLVRMFIIGRKLYIDREAYKIGCEIDNTPALFDTIPGARKWPIVADSARPETISYMKRHGYPRISNAAKGPGSIEDGIEFLKNYDIVVHPDCRHVIDELSLFSYKTDKKTEEVLPILEDKKNHTIDAVRYAIEKLRKNSIGKIPDKILAKSAIPTKRSVGRIITRKPYANVRFISRNRGF